MIYIAAHALGLALLLLSFQGTGALLVRAIPALDRVGRRTGLIRVATGIATWMYLLVALASLGLLRRPILFGISSIIIVTAAIRGLWTPGARLSSTGDSATDRPWTWRMHAVAWIGPAIVLAALIVLAMWPWIAWDDNTYHLTLPKLYLQSGGFRRVPYNVYSNFPLNVEVLYALAMAVQDYVLAKLVHVAFLLLLTIAVYR